MTAPNPAALRYFYPAARAHHAYCMAVDFGMEFKSSYGFWEPEGLLHITGAAGYKIEVAEESLGLLELAEGDIAIFKGALGNEISATYDKWLPQKELASGALLRIIQRDGKPFHWPESEGI